MRRASRVMGRALVVVALAGCDGGETDTPLDTVETGFIDTAVPDSGETAEEIRPKNHCGRIDTNEVWTAEFPHLVKCDLEIEGGSIQIDPGVQVLFADGAAIYISEKGFQGGLVANGTADAPVIFEPLSGPGRGKFDGIKVAKDAGNVTLRHTVIRGGGQRSLDANLVVEGTGVTLDHVTLEQSRRLGLRLGSGAFLRDGSTDLVVRDNGTWSVQIQPDAVHTLPFVGSGYDGNHLDGILIPDGDVEVSVTWEDLGVPYVVGGTIDFDGIAVAPAVLTLPAGVEMLFGAQSRIRIGSNGGASGLIADGTRDAPVYFGPLGTDLGGYWRGIEVYAPAVVDRVVFRNAIIEGAGSGNTPGPALLVDHTHVTVEDLTIRDSLGAGFELQSLGAFYPDSHDLVVEDCASPGSIEALQAGSLPTDGSYTGNDHDVVTLTTKLEQDVDAFWPKIDVPYWLDGTLAVKPLPGSVAALEIDKGVEVQVGLGGGITFAVGAPDKVGLAEFYAEGTAAEPIQFTAASAFQPGAWKYLRFDNCSPGGVRMSHVDLGYGGFGGGSTAVLQFDGCTDAELDHVTVHHSEHWGLGGIGATELDPTVTFHDNVGGDVRPL